MLYEDEVAGNVCTDGGRYSYEFVERGGTFEVRARLVSAYLASLDAGIEPIAGTAPLVTLRVVGGVVTEVVSALEPRELSVVASLCLRALSSRARIRLGESVSGMGGAHWIARSELETETETEMETGAMCTRRVARKRARHLKGLRRMGPAELMMQCADDECDRDYFFGLLEALAVANYAPRRKDDDVSVTYEVLGCEPLVGRVRRIDGVLHVTGTLFTCSYVALRGRAFLCSNLHEFLRWKGWRDVRADEAYSALATAMEACSEFEIVHPSLDAIAPCVFDGSEAAVAADCAGVLRGLRLDVHLPSGAYMFGHHSVCIRKATFALASVLGSCSGENVWRVRGRLALGVAEALRLSARHVGKSAVAFTEATCSAGDDRGHRVCGVLVVKRRANYSVVSALVLLRNSYAADNYNMSRVLAAVRADPSVLADAAVALEWVARGQRSVHKPSPKKQRAVPWHIKEEAHRWRTQWGEGSCVMHALMFALMMAQTLVIEQLTDAERIREAMRARCPPVYGAICSRALANLHAILYDDDVDPRYAGAVWDPVRGENRDRSAMAMYTSIHTDARVILHGTVTLDGEVSLALSCAGSERNRSVARGSVGYLRPIIDCLLDRTEERLRVAAARRGRPVVARVQICDLDETRTELINEGLRARGFQHHAKTYEQTPSRPE
jgi:hypothetical protein